MNPTAFQRREKRIVQALFVVVLLTFFAAERARLLLDSMHAATEAAMAGRAATRASAALVALHR